MTKKHQLAYCPKCFTVRVIDFDRSDGTMKGNCRGCGEWQEFKAIDNGTYRTYGEEIDV